jgi:DNA polymerase (family 10)
MGGTKLAGRRATREEGLDIAREVFAMLDGTCARVEICGSLRRGKPDVGDVDLVLLPMEKYRSLADAEAGVTVLDLALHQHFGTQKNGKPKRSVLVRGVQVDVLITDSGGWGACVMHWTGSAAWNVRQRGVAIKLGYKLNEKGLWEGEKRIAGATEEEVYKALGEKWTEPKDRGV